MSAAIASLSSTTNTTSTNNNDVIDEEEQQLLATIKKSEARICGHMNEDHETSLLAYARFYAKLNNAVRPIKMVQMTPEGFVLDVTLQNNDGTTELKKGVVVKYPNGRMTTSSPFPASFHASFNNCFPSAPMLLPHNQISFNKSNRPSYI